MLLSFTDFCQIKKLITYPIYIYTLTHTENTVAAMVVCLDCINTCFEKLFGGALIIIDVFFFSFLSYRIYC